MANKNFFVFLSALAFFTACSGGNKKDNAPRAEISLTRALLSIPGSPEKFFITVTGEGMPVVSKTISGASVSNAAISVPSGRGRQIKVMAAIGLSGEDFVTPGSFKYIYGASDLFDLRGGDDKEVDITLHTSESVSAASYPFIVKFADAQGQPVTGASVSFRRSSDGFLLGDMATTDANGIAYTRFLRFPFAVDVILNGEAVASSLDFTANTLSGNYYLVNSAPTVVAAGDTYRIAVGIFSKGPSALVGHTLSSFATSIANKQEPFNGGVIPDLSSKLSSNANLSGLSLSTGTLSPVFSATVTSYTASVANVVTTLQVTPTVADTNAVVRVNGTTVTSGTASGSVSLAVGANTLTVLVTAQNGATKTYTITVTRAASANNNLTNLTLSSGELSPVFAAGTLAYTAAISDIPSAFTATPTAQDTAATIQVRLNSGGYSAVNSGFASSSLSPTTGANTLDVLVTAASGAQKTYSVAITYGICAAGYYSNGTSSCVQVTRGFWSPANDNSRYVCINKPANSRYTSPTAASANCPWSCNDGYISNGTSCNSYPAAQTLSCDDNEVAVGLWGRSGSIIDKLGVRCRAFNDGKFSGAARSGPGYGGEGGGPFNYDGSYDCPDGSSLYEVDGFLAVFYGVNRSGQIRFRCKSVSDGTISTWSPNGGYFGSFNDRGAFNFKCGTSPNQYGSHVNGLIIDNAGTTAYTSDTLGITCR